jgi:VCBS repeat-containing protein
MLSPRKRAIRWLAAIGIGWTALAVTFPSYGQISAADDAYSTEAPGALNVDEDDGVLANDSGGDEDEYAAVLVAAPEHGTLVLSGDGGFSYLPNPGFTGGDSFTYRVDDGEATSNVATVTITVSSPEPSNEPPVAVDDSYSVAEGTRLDVNAANGVLANDTDAGPAPLTAVLTEDPDHGSLTLNADGSFSYTPEDGFSGNDEFRYRARDGAEAMSPPRRARIAVSATNDPPVAVADSYSTNAGQTLNVDGRNGVLDNDTDPDGDKLAAFLVSDASSGTLTLEENGGFRFVPAGGFSGTATFTYQAGDGTARSNTATVTITVNAVNGRPSAEADSYSTNEGETLNVGAANGVLANDTDPDGDALTAILVSGPPSASGTLSLQPSGAFSFVPAAGFDGTVTFKYQAGDGAARSNDATVTIKVNAVNAPPTARADSYTTNEGQTLNVSAGNGVLDNDTDPDGNTLTAVLVGEPSSGTLTLAPNGGFVFAPAAGFTGPVTFTYEASDGTLRSSAATVTITVNSVNDPPTAKADSYTTAEDTALTVAAAEGVLANDSDPDAGTTLTAALARTVTNGSLTLRPDGSFIYTPAANFSGTTTFTYRARDGSETSEAVTVTIAVTAANDAPFISNSPPTTASEGVTYRYTLAASDPDDDKLTITAPTLPSWLHFSAPATVTGTPAQSDVGTHDVTMQVSDGIAGPVVARFKIAVQAVDNAPTIATIPAQTVSEGAAFDLDLAPFVTDADTPAAELEYAATGGLPPGMTLSAGGRLSGTPTLGKSVGAHTVRFTVADAATKVPAQVALNVIAAGHIDLAVTVSVTPTPVPLEAPVTWTITVANRAANVDAPGAKLEASFTGDVPFRFDAPTAPECTATNSGNRTSLSCTLGALAGGASTPITLTGRGSFAGDVFAHAAVAATGPAIDEVTSNDTATASLSVAQRISGAPEQRIADIAARAVAAADFNGDGFDDLVVATASPQGVVLLPNIVDPANAARRMLAPTPQSLGGEALGTDLAVVDLDRDDDLDVVLAAAAGAPDRAFLAAGESFTSTALGAAAQDSRAVAAADVNGDAFVDLVFASKGGSPLLMNTGSGGVFTSGPRIGAGDAVDVLLVDVLGDSLPELVVANADGDAALYGNSGGVFTLARTLSTGPTSAVASGDFNGDGRADLVFGRATATPPGVPAALVFLNGAELFVADELGAATTSGLLVRDFDLDGRADVLASSATGQRLFSNAGAANGTFVLHPQQLATPAARGVAAGRFSSDDRVDVAVAGDGVAMFVNDGKGNFGSGDSTPPTLTLRGESTVNVVIDAPFTDPGATASDAVDGDLTSRIVVTGSVDTAVLGTYTLTYTVSDLSGNAATPVTRTVNVQAQPGAADEGGSGALEPGSLLLLLLAVTLARLRRRLR